MSNSEIKENSVDNLTQPQRDCISILSIYKNSIEKTNYEQCSKFSVEAPAQLKKLDGAPAAQFQKLSWIE